MKRINLTICFLLLWAMSLSAQDDAALTHETVKKSTIEGHIYFLASDELRGRDTGSPELDIAARYLATSFQRYGVKPVSGYEDFFQHVALYRMAPPKEIKLSINKKAVSSNDIIRIEGENIDIKNSLVYLNYGSEADFAEQKLDGKIVLVKAGLEDKQDPRSVMMGRYTKASLAKAAGALGVIEIMPEGVINWEQMYATFNRERVGFKPEERTTDFFFLWVRTADKKWAEEIIKTKKTEANVKIGTSGLEASPSKNVIGMVEGTDPELKKEFVMYSAHYDHIGVGLPDANGDSIYNGARDNAVGTVTVMSAAENIARYPTKRSALFVLFTGEERGMLGSRYLAENPVIPLEQIVFCFNSDNGGYNDTSLATIVGLERTTVAPHIKKAAETFGLKAIDDPAGEQGLFDRSDNVQFARKGIPAPTYSLGFTAFDEEIGKYYHQQSDNPETLDYDYLEKFFKSYVMSCRLIANDPQTPFWVEGDKYYDTGLQLYGRD